MKSSWGKYLEGVVPGVSNDEISSRVHDDSRWTTKGSSRDEWEVGDGCGLTMMMIQIEVELKNRVQIEVRDEERIPFEVEGQSTWVVELLLEFPPIASLRISNSKFRKKSSSGVKDLNPMVPRVSNSDEGSIR
jgi:hypothetical protein